MRLSSRHNYADILLKMALDNCGAVPKSNALDNGGGDKEYHWIPNESNSSDR